MRRNTRKMHTFYTADAQEHEKNAYILYRGCAGTRQKCIHSIPRMRRNTTKMHTKKGHPDRFRAIPDQVPEKCFFQGYRLCRPDAQNAGKHVYSIRRIAQNTEKHVYSIRRIAQNAGKHVYSIRRIGQNTEKHVYSIRRIAQNAEKHVYSIRRIGQNTEKHVYSIRRIAQNAEKHVYSIKRIATLHIKMHIFYMPDSHLAHKNACILYAGSQHCT
jgi:hypothetical protein